MRQMGGTMKKVMIAGATLLMAFFVSSCATGPSYASNAALNATTTSTGDIPNWRLEPYFGTVNLSAGFSPDPNFTDVLAGGSVNLASLGYAGFVGDAPDVDLNYDAGEYVLFIYVAEESEDTVLLVNDPEGNWHYADDTIGTRPGIRFDPPLSGLYDIWIGTYGSEMVDATLAISEIPWDDAVITSDGTMPNWRLEPGFGSVELQAGFKNDPYVVPLIAGGPVDLNSIGYYGMVAEAPDFDVYYEASGATLYIYVSYAEGDTVLLVNDPDGNWLFNDDASGLNPGIAINNPASGLYDIWVGTFEDDLVDANLVISEFSW